MKKAWLVFALLATSVFASWDELRNGWSEIRTPASSGASPGGTVGQLQYNDAGTFGGVAGILYDPSLGTVYTTASATVVVADDEDNAFWQLSASEPDWTGGGASPIAHVPGTYPTPNPVSTTRAPRLLSGTTATLYLGVTGLTAGTLTARYSIGGDPVEIGTVTEDGYPEFTFTVPAHPSGADAPVLITIMASEDCDATLSYFELSGTIKMASLGGSAGFALGAATALPSLGVLITRSTDGGSGWMAARTLAQEVPFEGAEPGNDGAAGFVPKPFSGDEGRFLRGDGTWATIPVFGAPQGETAGTSGAVPAPQPGDETRLLRGDGTWVDVAAGISNSAGSNVVPKSDGTDLITSSITDDGTTLTLGNAGVTVTEATGAVGLTAQAVGTTPLTIAGTSGQTAPVLSFGPAAAAPINVTIAGQDGSGTNVAGQTVTHRPGLGTGTGGSGSLILQAAPVDATGSAANTPQAVATFAKNATTITTTTPTAVAATTAGNSVTIAASNATAGLSSAGAATGGNVNITAGNAARYTSGNANGGNINLDTGTGIGTGTRGNIILNGSGSTGTTLYPGAYGMHVGNAAYVYIGGFGGEHGLFVASSGKIGFSASATSPGYSYDTHMRRKAAANPAWGAQQASPVAYTHTLSGESRGGTDTDVQGAAAIIQPGNGTGTGGSGTLKTQTAYPGTTGTTANTYSDREVFAPKWTTLAETTATSLATLAFGASSVVGAEFFITVEANDGTEYQALTSRVRVTSVRKATGNTVSSVSIVGSDTVATSTGTLTLNAATITEGASSCTVNLDVTSSLTQTTLRASFQAIANGPDLTITQN